MLRVFLLTLSLLISLSTFARASDWEELSPQLQQAFFETLPGGKNYFNSLPIQLKVSASCVMSRILVDHIPLKELGPISEIGIGGVLLFHERNVDATKRFIEDVYNSGFRTVYGASYKRVWGYRSPYGGAALHISRKKVSSPINIHLDLNNPNNTRSAITHLREHFSNWEVEHPMSRLVRETYPRGCGLGPSVLAKIKVYEIQSYPMPKPQPVPTPVEASITQAVQTTR